MAPRPHSASYLRAHSHTGYVPQSARPASVQPSTDKLTVPKASTARDVHISLLSLLYTMYYNNDYVMFYVT